MNTQIIGKRISEQRKKCGLTQEQLAERLGVTPQAVSKWENGRNLPDIDNLLAIADCLRVPYAYLVAEEEGTKALTFRGRLFHEDNMYTRVKTFAQLEGLENTLAALEFMRVKHSGQLRKASRFTSESVAYINHPLMMACHAHAMGITDDAVLAAILLHDVVEDTDTRPEELPVSEEIREIVRLVTFRMLPGKTKQESKAAYYENISRSKKACLVKIIDRCNNVSTMAGCFSRERLAAYIEETERYIMPLIKTLKDGCPEYSNAAFLVKYQIIGLLESIKAFL